MILTIVAFEQTWQIGDCWGRASTPKFSCLDEQDGDMVRQNSPVSNYEHNFRFDGFLIKFLGHLQPSSKDSRSNIMTVPLGKFAFVRSTE
jgi:hypothetical protein